jgi:hypothetical protein
MYVKYVFWKLKMYVKDVCKRYKMFDVCNGFPGSVPDS